MLVTEGMNSRRSRRALVLCMAPMREHGAGGAFSAIFIDVVELATIEPGVRLVCAHSPNSPIGAALDASGAGVGCGATSARPYCARRASDCAIFSLASACRASAFCIASRVARFSLLASQPRQRSLSCFAAFTSRCAAESSTALSAAATFIAMLFLCLPLCACQALLLWP